MKLAKGIKLRVSEVIGMMDALTFPEFMLNLRRATGLSRREVCDIVEMDCNKLYYIEKGLYWHRIRDHELKKLAELYMLAHSKVRRKFAGFTNGK